MRWPPGACTASAAYGNHGRGRTTTGTHAHLFLPASLRVASLTLLAMGIGVAAFGDEVRLLGPLHLWLHLPACVVGCFGGALLAERLGAAFSTWQAALFGLAVFALNAIMALPVSAAFVIAGALGTAVGAALGVRAVRVKATATVERPGRTQPPGGPCADNLLDGDAPRSGHRGKTAPGRGRGPLAAAHP